MISRDGSPTRLIGLEYYHQEVVSAFSARGPPFSGGGNRGLRRNPRSRLVRVVGIGNTRALRQHWHDTSMFPLNSLTFGRGRDAARDAVGRDRAFLTPVAHRLCAKLDLLGCGRRPVLGLLRSGRADAHRVETRGFGGDAFGANHLCYPRQHITQGTQG